MQKNLDLKNLIKDYEYENTTDKIRELKHSSKIRKDVGKMIELKKKYTRLSNENKKNIISRQCNFLFSNYTNIFNKIYNDTIDLNLFHKFLVILEGIENGKFDQHQASAQVGKILKEIYLDSAIREADKKREVIKRIINKEKVKKFLGKNTKKWRICKLIFF